MVAKDHGEFKEAEEEIDDTEEEITADHDEL